MNRETALLSVALARYADSCPPTLHPDCPFAEETRGQRTCQEQCREEIVRLSKPGHSGVSVFSGPLFDAKQYLLSESTKVPDANWHTSSLIQRLYTAIMHPPRNRDGDELLVREIDITNSLAYLGQRGFDPDWLARFGFMHVLPTRLTLWVIDNHIHRAAYGSAPTPAGGWLPIFESHVGDVVDIDTGHLLAAAQRSGFINWVERWLHQAALECIVSWTPIEGVAEQVAIDNGQARWMVDRFKETYLNRWADGSLHHEYRFLRGVLDPPAPRTEMIRRQVTKVSVDGEIARRSVEGAPHRLADVTIQAASLLTEGRRREAAALFDAARILDPRDADAHNNYGFCLIVDEPAEALKALVRAQELGSKPPALNRFNQAVALRQLDRLDDALEVAERAYAIAGSRSELVWLWEDIKSPGGPNLSEVDLATSICELGLELATKVEGSGRVGLWRERLQSVTGDITGGSISADPSE